MEENNKNLKYEPDFLLIPYQLIVDSKLTPLDRLIYGVVYWFSSMSQGKCTASNQTIGDILKSSSSSVSNSINRLVKRKYINGIYDKSNHQRLALLPLVTFLNFKNPSHYLMEGDTLSNGGGVPLSNGQIYINNKKEKKERKGIISAPGGDKQTIRTYPFLIKGETRELTLTEATNHLIKLWARKFERNENQYKITDKKKELVKVRLKRFSVRELALAILYASQDDFYGGRKSSWVAEFTWIMKNDENVEKCLSKGVKRKPIEEDDGYEDLSKPTKTS